MKRKIISLAICVACLLTVLASCGSTPACEAHVDADKNSVCDNCGVPVVTIVEKVPTEEEIVEMIVAAIPEGATLGDIYGVTAEADAVIGALAANENFKNIAPISGSYRYVKYMYNTQTKGQDTTEENWPSEEEWTGEETWTPDGWKANDRYVRTYAVYDLVENKNVITYEVTEEFKLGDTHVNSADVTIEGFFFKVETTVWTSEEENNQVEWTKNTTVDYRFFDGTVFVDEAKVAKDETFYAPVFNSVSLDGSVIYYTVDDVMYAFDTETYKELAKGDVTTFIKRPAYNYKTDAYGLVVRYGEVYVYDLTKWIECVYSYEIPAGARYFFLDNGNILVQEEIILPESAVNYDYTDGAYKYDLVHTVVDIANKTETNLELGYYVQDVMGVSAANVNIAETVKNQLEVNPITNKEISNKVLYLICDDALAVKAEWNAVLPDFVSDVELVADGVFKGEVVYGEGSAVTKLFNAKGEVLATLPTGATLTKNWVKNDGKYYDFSMNLLLDPAAAEKVEDRFTVWFEGKGFVLLKKGLDTYYWNATLTEPALVSDATNVEMVPSEENPDVLVPKAPEGPLVETSIYVYSDSYFIVRTVTTTTTPAEVEGEPDEVVPETTYTLYNSVKEAVLTTDAIITVDSMVIDGETVWSVQSGGVFYFAK